MTALGIAVRSSGLVLSQDDWIEGHLACKPDG